MRARPRARRLGGMSSPANIPLNRALAALAAAAVLALAAATPSAHVAGASTGITIAGKAAR